MLAPLLALTSSVLWGTGDFLGGRASRNHAVLVVLFWSQAAMVLLVWSAVAIAIALGALDLDPRALLIGAGGGMAGVIALGAFYKALAIGPMSVVPPIAAAGVLIPVAVGLATGAPPSTMVLVGIVLAILGVVLASAGEGTNDDSNVATRIAPATLGLCLIAATGFGIIFVAMDYAAGDNALTALAATAGIRVGSFAALAIAVLFTRTRPWAHATPRQAAGFAAIGLFDTGANFTFAVAAALGELEIVAVLGTLYPAVTSALAHVVLGEKLGRTQLAGVVLAIAGVVVLAMT
ncbi:MAG: family transporter [Thermoleophilia bacterium]|nr:family transporter [Thermoleophilia bacterium]